MSAQNQPQELLNCRPQKRVKIFRFFGTRNHTKAENIFTMESNVGWKVEVIYNDWPCCHLLSAKRCKTIGRGSKGDVVWIRKVAAAKSLAIYFNLLLPQVLIDMPIEDVANSILLMIIRCTIPHFFCHILVTVESDQSW